MLTKDKQGYFTVNKKACGDYLNYLQSSKLLSAKYIAYWKTYLDDKALMLKKERIKSDVPEGFDFDFVLITQEPEIVLDKIDSLQFNIASLSNRTAIVEMKLASDSTIQYEFEMRRSGAGWLIAYISTPNYD